MINIENIKFSYDKSETIFDNFSLNIDKGEFLCIVGNSGCGKSTLLRLIAGLEFPQEGLIKVDNEPVKGPSIDRSIVFQSYSLFPWLSVENNLKFALKASKKFTKEEIVSRTGFYIEKVGLSDSKKKYPFQLSGGMRQRTAFARSLALDSKILLLDEPFGALDTKIRKELQDLVSMIWHENQEKTIILITHDLREALSVASRIVFMQKGLIIEDMKFSEAERNNFKNYELADEKLKLISKLEALYE